MKNKLATTAVLLGIVSAPTVAGVTYKDGDKYVKFGGRIQLQYHQVDAKNADSTDDVFFRRFRPYIEGSIHPGWSGKLQWDMGKASDDNELSIKDAYMQNTGYNNMKVTLGNYMFPFSRETLTSSKYLQVVERTFVGDDKYGSINRQAGLYIEGHSEDKKFDWALGLADGRIDPDANRIDFGEAVNEQADWNEGKMAGARVSYHPFGSLALKRGDFKGDQKSTISFAAYSWSNDDDNNSYTDETGLDTSGGSKPDLDSVTGVEMSGAYRNSGISVDVQYNIFNAETIDKSVTSGIFINGETEMTSYAIDGGYMVIPSKLELVAAISSQDADGYTDTWNRTEIGINWFVHKHDIKYQLSHRSNENMKGQKNNDRDEIYMQAQYVF